MNNTLKVMLDSGAYAPVRAHEDDAGLEETERGAGGFGSTGAMAKGVTDHA